MKDTMEESLLDQQKWEELRTLLTTKPATEVAEILSGMAKTHRVLLYHLLPPPQSFDVFSYLEPEIQNSLLTE